MEKFWTKPIRNFNIYQIIKNTSDKNRKVVTMKAFNEIRFKTQMYIYINSKFD